MLSYKAVEIAEGIYWVGAIDWAVRDFHGYLTGRGTTYNAYLILDEKPTLIDTVKECFAREMYSRIASVIDPASIEYIVSNHAEPDHSGALRWTMEKLSPARVFVSKMGAEALREHYELDDSTVVSDGEELSIGRRTLKFLETRMLHWPDSMFTYLTKERILFSQDAFGMHLASSERFADEVDRCKLEYEAAKYYANILMPYSRLVPRLVQKLEKEGVEPVLVAPDHGPIYRRPEDIGWILSRYAEWAERRPRKLAAVIYDTMWHSTEHMAEAMAEGITSKGVKAVLLPLKGTHRSDVATVVLEAGALAVGSPTINNNIYPAMADVMNYLKGLKPAGLLGVVFGSYGWSGEATGILERMLDEMKVERVTETVKVKYVPGSDDLEACRRAGERLAEAVIEKVEAQDG